MSGPVGEHAWFVRLGESRIVRFEFGEPHLTVHAPQGTTMTRETLRLLRRRIVVPSGRRGLFVEDGLWTVGAGGLKRGRDDLDPAKTMPCLEILSGQNSIWCVSVETRRHSPCGPISEAFSLSSPISTSLKTASGSYLVLMSLFFLGIQETDLRSMEMESSILFIADHASSTPCLRLR